jgi:Zn finger protein HypA/HybF involved in hydrogenase expression
MPTKRERRPAELKCQECGYEFVASVSQVGHSAEESSQSFLWVVDRIDVTCPNCRSRFVGERNA